MNMYTFLQKDAVLLHPCTFRHKFPLLASILRKCFLKDGFAAKGDTDHTAGSGIKRKIEKAVQSFKDYAVYKLTDGIGAHADTDYTGNHLANHMTGRDILNKRHDLNGEYCYENQHHCTAQHQQTIRKHRCLLQLHSNPSKDQG